jgi:hypothetical protein
MFHKEQEMTLLHGVNQFREKHTEQSHACAMQFLSLRKYVLLFDKNYKLIAENVARRC